MPFFSAAFSALLIYSYVSACMAFYSFLLIEVRRLVSCLFFPQRKSDWLCDQ